MVRFKNRYILCELVDDNGQPVTHQWNDHEVYIAVRNALTTMHGDYGMASLRRSLHVKYMNKSTGVVLIRAGRSGYRLVSSTLPFIKSVKNIPISFRSLHLGGTMRSCQKFLLKHHRRQLVAILGKCTDPALRKKIQDAIHSAKDASSMMDQKEEVVEEDEDDLSD